MHAHDWQAGLAPVYLKTLYEGHPVLGGTPSVFTIHNLAYQGVFASSWLPRLDLPGDLVSSDRLEYWGRISFLKGGINDADLITTVSPKYAEEIQTPEFGFGFDGIVRRRAADLFGILNGIDTEKWDPERDGFLPAPYSASDLSNKRAAKAAVLERYRLPVDERTMTRPVIGMISRMVEQKGLDLIAASAGEIPRLEATFIVLGTGDSRYEALWRDLAAAYPDRIGAQIGFDEALAHLIEGGADMFLMPSRFEPCGLNQMYSLRYGTVPIVRAVGGLADTVEDGATGFVFAEYTAEALLQVLRRALTAFQDPRNWRALQLAGMKQDHSWDRSAREYVRIYERAITRPGLWKNDPEAGSRSGVWSQARSQAWSLTGEWRERMAADNVQTFTDGNFETSVLKAGGPVLVDFWAEWCGPCKRLAPTIDALATDYAGKVTIGKLNVDENPGTASKFQIRGIPAVLLFKDGAVVESVVGLAPKEEFKKAIEKHL